MNEGKEDGEADLRRVDLKWSPSKDGGLIDFPRRSRYSTESLG